MKTIQIETITLADGSKMNVIRDIEKVQKLIDSAAHLAHRLRLWSDSKGPIFHGDEAAISEWEALQ